MQDILEEVDPEQKLEAAAVQMKLIRGWSKATTDRGSSQSLINRFVAFRKKESKIKEDFICPLCYDKVEKIED